MCSIRKAGSRPDAGTLIANCYLIAISGRFSLDSEAETDQVICNESE